MNTPSRPAKPGQPAAKAAATKPTMDMGETAAPSGPGAGLDETEAPPPGDDLGATEAMPGNAPAAPIESTHAFQEETQADTGLNKSQAAAQKQGASAAKPGQKLNALGDFKLLKKLGAGGMGEVYQAHQVNLDRQAAVKVMAKHLASNKSFVERFYREARIMAKLDHPNIIRSYHVGEAHGHHFLAMEFVDGGSLQDQLKKTTKLSIGDSIHIILACARALEHANEHSIVHRDIKPDNVMLTKNGVVKLADLGLAKATAEDVGLTQSGVGAGTPLYMAPEQAANAKYADHRSDIYSLGCMLYCLLTGTTPFKGETSLELIKAKEAGTFPPARRVNSEIPAKLDLMIDKMIARKPELRYQTCTELIADLESLALASPSLSFVQAKGGAARLMVSSPGQATRGPTGAKTSAPGAAKADAETAELWYVTYIDETDKKVTKHLTLARIKTLIQEDKIDEGALACHNKGEKKRPLLTFKEFEHLLRAKLAKAAADRKGSTNKFQSLYKQIAADEQRQKRWGWLKKLWKPIKDWGMLIFWLGVLAGGLYGAYLLVDKFILNR